MSGGRGKVFDHWGQPFDLWQKLFDGISIEGISQEDLTKIGGNFKKCLIEYANAKDAALLAVEKENGELRAHIEELFKISDIVKALKSGLQRGTITVDKEAFRIIWAEEIDSLKAELEAEKQKRLALELQVGKLIKVITSTKQVLNIAKNDTPLLIGQISIQAEIDEIDKVLTVTPSPTKERNGR